jgi:Flp pilus assembly protein TadG
MILQRTSKTRRRGATVVEYAIVISATFFLLLAVFEYGRFVMIRHLIDNATREGARLAAAGTTTLTTPDIENRVTTALGGQQLGGLTVQVYESDAGGSNVGPWTDASFGERIAVQIDCTYTPILPSLGFLPNPVTLRSKSVMRSEAN